MTTIALVTVASGGMARALPRPGAPTARQGCRVSAVSRNASRLAGVEAAVRIAADTTTPEGATRLTGQVIAVDGGFTTVRPLREVICNNTQELGMSEDLRCCGSGTCVIDNEGRCWCGQQWEGEKLCQPSSGNPVDPPAPELKETDR